MAPVAPEAPALGEEEDVLASIRQMKALLNKEFADRLSTQRQPPRGTTTTTTNPSAQPETNNSWKTQVYQLKQAHWEEKTKLQAKLDVQRTQLSRLNQQVDALAKEAETEHNMRKTMEETLEKHDQHTHLLTKQLDQAKEDRKLLEEKTNSFHQAVEDGKSAVVTERSTFELLVKETRNEKDRAWKKAGEEEAGRLRAESQAKELQKSVKLMQMRLQDAQTKSELVAKQHAQEQALAKKASNQKIAHLQEQIQKLKKAKEDGTDASESELTVKALRLKVKKCEEESAFLQKELQKKASEKERDVAKHRIAYGRVKEQLEESEASREKMAQELEAAKRNTAQLSASQPALTPLAFSAVHTKRAKMIQNFEKNVAKDTNVVDSLVSQIHVMKKAQPSKKVKESLAAKKKDLREKRDSHIKTLEKIEKLQTQQLQELHEKLDKVTSEVETARQNWLVCEQELTSVSAKGNQNLQAKTDAAATKFSAARRQWQAVKSELSKLLSQISENRGNIADLRNPDDGSV
ncbi:MAG: hypothetical protein SGARI_002172, partial [Bacillariaceae sp.]